MRMFLEFYSDNLKAIQADQERRQGIKLSAKNCKKNLVRRMVYADLLKRFTEMSKQILGSKLVGVYLHGSAAMGCFNRKKSDLDLILIVEGDISDMGKVEFMRHVVNLNEEAPEKGFELSVVRREYCNPFAYPTPYELHFSVGHLKWFLDDPIDYVKKMKGTDKDLAAHFMIIRKYGIVLYGEEIDSVFGTVPEDDYIDSILFDIEGARGEILENPMYFTLNLCRVLAYLREGKVLSKRSGGEWGLDALPNRFHGMIQDALHSYETDLTMAAAPETLSFFANYMIEQIMHYKV